MQASKRDDVESFFFMADLHALIKCHDPDRIEKSRMQIAASWLACGLDPEHVRSTVKAISPKFRC